MHLNANSKTVKGIILLHIRKYQAQDLTAVSTLAMHTFAEFNGSDYFDIAGVNKTIESWNPAVNNNLIEALQKTDIFYVAVEARKIVGFIRGTYNYLNTLMISGAQHKHGTGRALMQAFEQQAIVQSTDKIILHSSLHAVSFYKKMGYQATSDITDFDGLKVIPMEKYFEAAADTCEL